VLQSIRRISSQLIYKTAVSIRIFHMHTHKIHVYSECRTGARSTIIETQIPSQQKYYIYIYICLYYLNNYIAKLYQCINRVWYKIVLFSLRIIL